MQIYNQSPSGSVYTRTNRLPELNKAASVQLAPAPQDVYFGAFSSLRRRIENTLSGGGGKPPDRPRKNIPSSHEVGEESLGAGSGGVIRARKEVSFEEAKQRGKDERNKVFKEMTAPPHNMHSRQADDAAKLAETTILNQLGFNRKGRLRNRTIPRLGTDKRRDGFTWSENVTPEYYERLQERVNRNSSAHGGSGAPGIEEWSEHAEGATFEDLHQQPEQGYGAEYVAGPASQGSSGLARGLGDLALESNPSLSNLARVNTGESTGASRRVPAEQPPQALTGGSPSLDIQSPISYGHLGSGGNSPSWQPNSPVMYNTPSPYVPNSPISYTPQAQGAGGSPSLDIQSPISYGHLGSGGNSPSWQPNSPTIGFTPVAETATSPEPSLTEQVVEEFRRNNGREPRTQEFINLYTRRNHRIPPTLNDFPYLDRPLTPVNEYLVPLYSQQALTYRHARDLDPNRKRPLYSDSNGDPFARRFEVVPNNFDPESPYFVSVRDNQDDRFAAPYDEFDSSMHIMGHKRQASNSDNNNQSKKRASKKGKK